MGGATARVVASIHPSACAAMVAGREDFRISSRSDMVTAYLSPAGRWQLILALQGPQRVGLARFHVAYENRRVADLCACARTPGIDDHVAQLRRACGDARRSESLSFRRAAL